MRRLIATAVFAITMQGADTGSPRVFIEPQGGFESYIAAAIIRKDVPVILTANRDDAAFVLTSSVQEERESGAGKIARCAFAYCIGITGTQAASVQLVSVKGVLAGNIVWAYNVRKDGATSYQRTAEAIAKHLKEYLNDFAPKKRGK